VSLGHRHTSKAAAHRSYAKVFHSLSVAALVLYWAWFYKNLSATTTKEEYSLYDRFKFAVGAASPEKHNRILTALSATGQRLKHVSKHPIISVTSVDVMFTIISLLAWTFTRNLDVEAILENSILAFLVPKHEKHVAFEDDAKRLSDLHSEQEPEPEPVVETTTPKKRGRPAKNKAAVNGATTSAAPLVRRSTRRGTRSADPDELHRDFESDGESVYQPSSKTKRAVAETEADGATAELDLVHGGESTALALFLVFVGGLGELASGALGAEVTGPRE